MSLESFTPKTILRKGKILCGYHIEERDCSAAIASYFRFLLFLIRSEKNLNKKATGIIPFRLRLCHIAGKGNRCKGNGIYE